jgi:hypothetical protein
MGAKVTFLEPTDAAPAAAHPLPRVTTRAIVTGQDGIRRVWIVDGATAHPARVDIAKEADGIAEIRSGLSGGETVVTDPPPELAEGKKIRPRA